MNDRKQFLIIVMTLLVLGIFAFGLIQFPPYMKNSQEQPPCDELINQAILREIIQPSPSQASWELREKHFMRCVS